MRVRAWCGAAVLALALAACGGGNGDASDQVASLSANNASSRSTSTTAPHKTMAEAARDFARCMRRHGVAMPDPKVSADGSAVQVQIGTGGGSPSNSKKLDAAQRACQHFMQAAGPKGGKRPDAKEEKKMHDQALAFARCMRQHGIDMPDPVFGADGSMRQNGPKVSSKDDKAFRDANRACMKKGGPSLQIKSSSGGGSSVGTSDNS